MVYFTRSLCSYRWCISPGPCVVLISIEQEKYFVNTGVCVHVHAISRCLVAISRFTELANLAVPLGTGSSAFDHVSMLCGA